MNCVQARGHRRQRSRKNREELGAWQPEVQECPPNSSCTHVGSGEQSGGLEQEAETYLRTTGNGTEQRGLPAQTRTALDCLWGILHQDGLNKATQGAGKYVREMARRQQSVSEWQQPECRGGGASPVSLTAWYKARLRMNRPQSVEGAAGPPLGL